MDKSLDKSSDVSLDKTTSDMDSDFPSMVKHLLYSVNWKLGIIMLVLGFIIFSNLFVDNVISKMSNTTEMGMVNTKGSVIQLLFYTLTLLCIDLMIKGNLL